jgi:hypothetical protein
MYRYFCNLLYLFTTIISFLAYLSIHFQISTDITFLDTHTGKSCTVCKIIIMKEKDFFTLFCSEQFVCEFTQSTVHSIYKYNLHLQHCTYTRTISYVQFIYTIPICTLPMVESIRSNKHYHHITDFLTSRF